jgi:putative heme transporter
VSSNVSTGRLRSALVVAVGMGLVVAVWFQRATIGSALSEMRSMPFGVIAALVLLGVVERLTRADIFRRLLSGIGLSRALTIHDVGAAASKGIPLGGPVAAGLRWSIARDADVPTTRFTSALVGYGVATTFVTWILPFTVLVIDVTQRQPTSTDLAMLGVCAVVLVGSMAFWGVVLNSDRVSTWTVATARRWWSKVSARAGRSTGFDPGSALIEMRESLHAIGRRPVGLLVRTSLAQVCSAVILLVALRGLGVGPELGTLEFARVYFVVSLLSSFVPVPGGIGVVEAGLTGALVAAGVQPSVALAGVLVYRLLTYVAPIVIGAVLYVVWRLEVRGRPLEREPVSPERVPAMS